MATEPGGSVTRWIDLVGSPDRADQAAQKLWEHYFERLVHLARARLRSSPLRAADEEDVALSAFDSFCRGAAAGRFPDLAGRDDLWRLLITITTRKAIDRRKHEGRQRRGGGKVVGEHALGGPAGDDDGGLDQIAGREPTPEFAALVADELGRLLDGLDDDALRRVAILRMEGYGNDEIAARLGCGRRTVERKLAVIRSSWLASEPG
jgi:DNA-directed RNA polymerase specialized sigma24 family protein